MRVNRNFFILSLIYALIAFACCTVAFMPYSNSRIALCRLGIVVTVELFTFIVINAKISGKMLNFAMVFICVLFVFNFGQLLIYTFFINIYSHVRFIQLMSASAAIHGFRWMSIAFVVICLSCLIFSIKNTTNYVIKRKTNINKINIENLSKKVIIFSFPVKLVIDILCLFVSITKGGHAARIWLNDVPNILISYGKISLVGFAMLIIVLAKNPKRQKKVFLFIVCYVLLMMISGIRSENVGYLLVFIFIYIVSSNKKIRLSSVIIYCTIGFFLLSFIVAVGAFRGAEKSVSSFVDIFVSTTTENNVLMNLLDTCGDTGYTTQEVINQWLPIRGPSYGDSFYIGWISIIPNIPKLFSLPGDLTAKTCFVLRLQDSGLLNENYLNIGGSLLGELFFNFGLVGGVLSCILVGAIIGWVSRKTILYLAMENYSDMVLLISVMFASIYWIRSYFGGEFRIVIWAPLLYYFISNFKLGKKFRKD